MVGWRELVGVGRGTGGGGGGAQDWSAGRRWGRRGRWNGAVNVASRVLCSSLKLSGGGWAQLSR